MVRITEITTKVTAGKAYEYRRCTRMMTFTLQTVEYFVNLPHP